MRGKAYINAIVVIALCFTVNPGTLFAAERTSLVSPAKFVDGEKSLGKLIKYPSVDGDYLTILNCFADVSTFGRMSDTVCSYQDESALVFAKAVERAGKSARLSPAILNGEKKKVWLQFTVIFIKDSDGEEIQVLNNAGENVDKYGSEYIGAQRIVLRKFPDTCSQYNDWFALTRVTITSEGLSKDFELDPSSRLVPKECPDTLRHLMLSSRYIPAFYEGTPVESTYAEPWFARRQLR